MSQKSRHISQRLICVARGLMPPERRNWADAMAHEFEALEADHLGFAFGCLWSAILSNCSNRVRMMQLGLGGIAASFVGLTLYCAWFTLSWLPNYADAPSSRQAAFVFGNLVIAAISIILSMGATIALLQARDRVAMSVVGIRTISAIAFVLAATFAGLAALHHWQNVDQTSFAAWAALGVALYATFGWFGFSKPDKLAMIGIVGLVTIGLWPTILQVFAIETAEASTAAWAFKLVTALPLIVLTFISFLFRRLGRTQPVL
jgi:hypothetical protein